MKSRQKPLTLVGDFETTTTADDCRVWLWGIVDIFDDERFDYDNSIESFFDYISMFTSTTYFHNLRFDGHFIVDPLLKDNYQHVKSNPKAGEFTSLISSKGQWYSVTVHWRTGFKTEFRDSLKKLPLSVDRIATAFNLDISKGELDYDAYRSVNHSPTPDELDYLERDLRIVAQALKVQLDQGMKKLTVGADSLAEYKALTGSKIFNKLFPILPEVTDAEIRKAYRGGFTYADDRFKGRLQGKGIVYDVNSLYPYIMYSRHLPYGEPEYFKNIPTDENYSLYIASVTFTAKLKKNHIPCIQIKGSYMYKDTEYVKEVKEPTTLMMTNVDLKLYQDHYNLTIISINGVWGFRGLTGVFNKYIDKWMGVKATSTGGMREIAKLHLNSLYGKFATNPNVTPKIPTLVDDKVKLVIGPDESREPVYTAMGVFITAYAREYTIRTAQELYPYFAYADTDSLHLLIDTPPSNIYVHPAEMGAWKLEYEFSSALYMRAKAYCEYRTDKDRHETHIAGLPQRISDQLTFDDLFDGNEISGKLNPRTTSGGVVLEPVTYKIKYEQKR